MFIVAARNDASSGGAASNCESDVAPWSLSFFSLVTINIGHLRSKKLPKIQGTCSVRGSKLKLELKLMSFPAN
jgi:hypothetical protein